MQSKNRCLRVSDEIWERWQALAKQRGLSMVAMIEADVRGLPANEAQMHLDPPKPKSHMQTRKVQMQRPDGKCNHAGTEIGEKSGVGSCPKCGRVVTAKEVVR